MAHALLLLAALARPETKMIDVGGHKLRARIMGASGPTVVLEAGFPATSDDWVDVMPEIAKFARVVAYDRAGLGGSEAGPEPRSFTQCAKELHTMLEHAGFTPPYVLVGHSMGGPYIRAFAHEYKSEIAGLVFVDPFAANPFRDAKLRKKIHDDMDPQMKAAPPGQQAEWRFQSAEIDKDSPMLRSYGAPPDVPMVLLVAGRNRPPGWVKWVLDEYGPWIAGATEGNLVVSSESTHYIQRDEPQVVLSAIRRVVFPSAENILGKVAREQGAQAAITRYRELKKRYPAEYLPEPLLNRLGYVQMAAKDLDGAIALFKLNVEMFPRGFNTYDSLAEAYMTNGDRVLAVKNYRKSLQLNPENVNATKRLEKLKP
jgi:hypothetical protein